MYGIMIIGFLFIIFGLISMIRGKIPFIKKYNGVKNIALHSRIEGSAILLVGLMMIISSLVCMDSIILIIGIIVISVVSLSLEVICKAI